jgi:rod shape determining protein RodA
MVLWRSLRIAAQSSDVHGRLLAVGIVAWFAFQSFQNIGMNLGIMPVTGVPLLFVSYGGSSLFAAWCAIGLLTTVSKETSLTRP